MTLSARTIPCALSVLVLALLTACGGGGGSDASSAPPVSGGDPPAAATTLTGTVATGAPFADAALTVFDRDGKPVCEVRTTPEGGYTCTLAAGTQAPLVIQAVRGDQTLYSITASAATGTTNVTPLTTIVAAQLAPQGDPSKLAGAAGTVTAAAISEQVAKLIAALQPLLTALNTTFDPMSGVFKADGTGQDRVLDTINVSVRPDGSAASIEVTVKALPADDASAPLSIVFRSDDASITPLPAISDTALVTPPTPAMVQALLDRINACYALPLNQRVNSTIQPDGNAYGGASNVVAPACRTLFVGDDPANFVSAGAPVGRVASGARRSFESLFRAGPTNIKYDRGNFEFFHPNGEILFTHRWTDVLGNTDNDFFNARIVDGALKLTPTVYPYRAFVRPQSEKRDYLKHQNLNYHSVGYTVTVDNLRDGEGAPLFKKVVVTTPSLPEREVVLIPKAGSSTLVITRDGTGATALNTSTLRLASRFVDPAQGGSPSAVETGSYFASPAYTEAQIRAIPEQSVWKLEFFHANTATPNQVQYVRTVSRAPTLAEAVQTPTVELVPAMRADLLAASQASARGIVFGYADPVAHEANNIDFIAPGNADAWVVPEGALAPTSLTAVGRAAGDDGARFSDSATVRNTARKTVVYCQPVASTDTHCAPVNGIYTQYNTGTTVSTFSFLSRTARQGDVRKNFEVWTVAQP